jgi:hypothetical protein
MDHQDIIERIGAELTGAAGLDGLILAGSHGWGRADQYSDLDFVLVAEPDVQPDLAKAWRRKTCASATICRFPARAAMN